MHVILSGSDIARSLLRVSQPLTDSFLGSSALLQEKVVLVFGPVKTDKVLILLYRNWLMVVFSCHEVSRQALGGVQYSTVQ